jgi:hypothetical protein
MNTIAQYKGRGNSLNNESSQQYIIQQFTMYKYTWKAQVSYLVNFTIQGKTRLPNSSTPPHGRRTTHQRFVHLVARSCCLPNLGTPPSRHTWVPLTETHLHPQSQHFTKSLCTLARWVGAHPSRQDTRTNSSHKPSPKPGATPVHATTVHRVPHTGAHHNSTTGQSCPHLHPQPRLTV